jgi:hypothetical protein
LIATPYTLEVHYKGYRSAYNAWHWGGPGGLTVSNGVVSGPVTPVSHCSIVPLISPYNNFAYGLGNLEQGFMVQ